MLIVLSHSERVLKVRVTPGVTHHKAVIWVTATYVALCSLLLPVSQQAIISAKLCRSAETGKKVRILSLKFLLHKLSGARTIFFIS